MARAHSNNTLSGTLLELALQPYQLTLELRTDSAVSLAWRLPGRRRGRAATKAAALDLDDVLTPSSGAPCVAAGEACTSTALGASAPAPGEEAAVVAGLPAGANVTCYAVPYTKLRPECSAGLYVALLPPTPPTPPTPTPVKMLSSKRAFFNRTALGWYVVRQVNNAGPGRCLHRAQNSTLIDMVCVLGEAGCNAPPQGIATTLDPSTSLVTVYDLTPETCYTCYARATGPDGNHVCSAGVRAFTGVEPPTELRAAVTSNSSLTLSWSLADQGVPASTYGGVCVAQGLACDAPSEGASPPPALNATSAPVTGLQPGTPYTCYAQAFNVLSGAAPFCSTGVDVTVMAAPGVPTIVRLVNETTTSVTLAWTPSPVGVAAHCVERHLRAGRPWLCLARSGDAARAHAERDHGNCCRSDPRNKCDLLCIRYQRYRQVVLDRAAGHNVAAT